MKYSAILFDLDGTLCDTIPDIAACLNRALEGEQLPPRPLSEYNQIIGSGIGTAVKRAAPEGTAPEVLERVLAAYRASYPDHATDRTLVYEGIGAVLKALQEFGVTLGVITNKTEKTAILMVNHYFPEIPFAFVWGNDGERPLKPSADAGALAEETLGIAKDRIAYVGDSDVDMQFAKNAGFYALGAGWGYRGERELLENGADLVAASPEDILKALAL